MKNSNNATKVTVIIPVYNTKEQYLIECIDSIIEQTYKNLEIIIVDDGSNEETALLCDEFSKKDNRIIVIHKKNEGVSVARNTGMSKATGKWIAFVDSDDLLVKNGIENLLVNNTGDIILSLASMYDDSVEKINLENRKEELIANVMLDLNKESSIGSPCNKLYNRKFLINNNIKFKDGIALGEDGIFNIMAYSKSNEIVVINKKVYIYRVNSGSVTQKYSEKTMQSVKKLLEFYRNELWDIVGEEYIDEYCYFVIRQLNYICIKQIFNKESNLNKKEKLNELKSLAESEICKEAIKKVNIKKLSPRRMILAVLLRYKLYFLVPYIYNENTFN